MLCFVYNKEDLVMFFFFLFFFGFFVMVESLRKHLIKYIFIVLFQENIKIKKKEKENRNVKLVINKICFAKFESNGLNSLII